MMLLGTNTSLEVLNLLNVLTRKYSFFKLRRVDSQSVSVDLEQNYLLDLNLNNKIAISDTCWLIGINPRYEGSKLNLRLRSRYLQGNFKIIQIGSLLNLTFPNVNITSNTKILKSLVEGNNLFCQEFVNSLNPILISNAQIFKRKDSFGFTNLLNFLSKHINLFSPDPVNVLHVGYDDVKNSWKQVSYNKENQQQLNDHGFFYKNVSSKNDIIYVNRKNLIIKYQQQKAQELKKRDKIKVLPYLSRKLVSQTKTSDLNLKIIPGPHPPFTFGELALIAGINVLYYFNKFLKKLGFKGFFFN